MATEKIQVSDIVYGLQQIDYKELLDVMSPIITFYVSSRLTTKTIGSIQVHRDYKPKNIKSVSLPPETISQVDDIDKERLIELQFGDSVLNFANTVMREVPHADLSFLCSNLRNLSVFCKNFELRNFIFNTDLAGRYSVDKNKICVRKKDYLQTIDHELLHMGSSFFRESDGMAFCGFSQENNRKFRKIGSGINEGYTQLLAERYFGDAPGGVLMAYILEVNLAKGLEKVVGKEKMECLFFKANLYGLIQELKQYENEEDIMKFITQFDYMSNHFSKGKLWSLERKLALKSLTDTNLFLIGCYSKKLRKEFDRQEIDFVQLNEKLIEFISNLKIQIINIKNEEDGYGFLNIGQIKSIIESSFDKPEGILLPLVENDNEIISKGK